MDDPPGSDMCSVFHGNFDTPCQANCSHWFCVCIAWGSKFFSRFIYTKKDFIPKRINDEAAKEFVLFVGAVLKEMKREEETEKHTREITPPKFKDMTSHATSTLFHLALITKNEARLWMDGRYFLQDTHQIDDQLQLMRKEEDPAVDIWMADVSHWFFEEPV